MRTVWKFPFNSLGMLQVELSEDNKVVMVGLDPAATEWNRERPLANVAVWIEHDPDAPKKEFFRFHIVGTGHDVADDLEHVGSLVQLPFVWHVYRELPPGEVKLDLIERINLQNKRIDELESRTIGLVRMG